MARKILDISEAKNGIRLKAIAWAVEKSKDFPEGVKYAFAYIINNRRVIGYDNERAKGHHRHFLNELGVLAEEKTEFTNIYETFKLFFGEVEKFKSKHENKQDSNQNSK